MSPRTASFSSPRLAKTTSFRGELKLNAFKDWGQITIHCRMRSLKERRNMSDVFSSDKWTDMFRPSLSRQTATLLTLELEPLKALS